MNARTDCESIVKLLGVERTAAVLERGVVDDDDRRR